MYTVTPSFRAATAVEVSKEAGVVAAVANRVVGAVSNKVDGEDSKAAMVVDSKVVRYVWLAGSFDELVFLLVSATYWILFSRVSSRLRWRPGWLRQWRLW